MCLCSHLLDSRADWLRQHRRFFHPRVGFIVPGVRLLVQLTVARVQLLVLQAERLLDALYFGVQLLDILCRALRIVPDLLLDFLSDQRKQARDSSKY